MTFIFFLSSKVMRTKEKITPVRDEYFLYMKFIHKFLPIHVCLIKIIFTSFISYVSLTPYNHHFLKLLLSLYRNITFKMYYFNVQMCLNCINISFCNGYFRFSPYGKYTFIKFCMYIKEFLSD